MSYSVLDNKTFVSEKSDKYSCNFNDFYEDLTNCYSVHQIRKLNVFSFNVDLETVDFGNNKNMPLSHSDIIKYTKHARKLLSKKPDEIWNK